MQRYIADHWLHPPPRQRRPTRAPDVSLPGEDLSLDEWARLPEADRAELVAAWWAVLDAHR